MSNEKLEELLDGKLLAMRELLQSYIEKTLDEKLGKTLAEKFDDTICSVEMVLSEKLDEVDTKLYTIQYTTEGLSGDLYNHGKKQQEFLIEFRATIDKMPAAIHEAIDCMRAIMQKTVDATRAIIYEVIGEIQTNLLFRNFRINEE
jgi:hypothetical protein